jgi:excisionase family DNA binding protein
MPHVNPGQLAGVLTLEQVSQRTGRNVSLLARWARAGRIPATKIGGSWLVAETDLPAIESMPRTPGRRPRKAKGER